MILLQLLIGLSALTPDSHGSYNLTFGALCPALLGQAPEPTPESRETFRAAVEIATARARFLQEHLRVKPSRAAAAIYERDGFIYLPRAVRSVETLAGAAEVRQFAASLPRLEHLELDVYALREGTVARGLVLRGREAILSFFDDVSAASQRNQREFERRFEEIFPYVTRGRLIETGIGTSLSLALGTYFGVGTIEHVLGPGTDFGHIAAVITGVPFARASFKNSAAGFAFLRGLLDPSRRPDFERTHGNNRKDDGHPQRFRRLENFVRLNSSMVPRGFIHQWQDVVLDRAEVEALKAAAAEGRGPSDDFFREFDRPRFLERDVWDVDLAFHLKLDHVLYQDDGEPVLLMFDRFVRDHKPGRKKKPRDETSAAPRWIDGPLVPQGI